MVNALRFPAPEGFYSWNDRSKVPVFPMRFRTLGAAAEEAKKADERLVSRPSYLLLAP